MTSRTTGEEEALPLVETKAAKGRAAYKLFSSTIFVAIVLIWVYRFVHFPGKGETGTGRIAWIGMFLAEVLFGLYWIITQSVRWKVAYRYPFKDSLSTRKEAAPPHCTAAKEEEQVAKELDGNAISQLCRQHSGGVPASYGANDRKPTTTAVCTAENFDDGSGELASTAGKCKSINLQADHFKCQ